MINRLLTCITKLRLYYLAIGAIGMSGLFSACEKDILEGQPEWLGNSVYERLEEGIEINGKVETFKTMLSIIDDLGQKEVLSKTGSKTIFAASDAAFEEWFKNNDWNVHSLQELNMNQKKILLFNAMVNNAYLVDLMSNVPSDPPQQGLCMRRKTAAGIFDTIYTMSPSEMPSNPLNDPQKDLWARYRAANQTLKILKDNTTPTMIHFLPKFMEKNGITDMDLAKITNGRSTSIQDSWINGRKIISKEQTCKNGYIYVVDGVIEPNRNMAEIINHNTQTTEWAKMINRFSLPLADKNITNDYKALFGTSDTLYTLRYFSDWTTWDGERGKLFAMISGKDTVVAPGTLLFDPGWNQYMYNNPMGFDLHYDAAAMIVPSDQAVKEWWDGPGLGLQQEYKELDSIPLKVLSKLLRVHMLPSFIESVPSKFNSIVDDAKAPLGIKPENVIECEMGCNGVVYITDQVFPPSEYRSVIYPALARESLMGVIYDAIDRCDFGAYLTARGPVYSMILPYSTATSINTSYTDNIYLKYIDPCTAGLTFQLLYEFYFDKTMQMAQAKCYPIKMAEDGTYTRVAGSILTPNNTLILNRLKDLVDNLIIIGSLNPEQKYYKTKAGSVIYVDYHDKDHVSFAGGWEQQWGKTIPSITTFDMGKEGNGISYGVPEAPTTATLSLYEVLKNHAKEDAECTSAADSAYRMFYELIQGDLSTNKLLTRTSGKNECANSKNNLNCTLFDNYNYTVYVPTNKAIRAMIEGGFLPTWADYAAATDSKEKEKIATLIHDFVRYHVQDNSVYIGGKLHDTFKSPDSESYETSKINDQTRRYYAVSLTLTTNSLEVTDQLNRTVHVMKDKGLYNNTCREYWIENQEGSQAWDKAMLLRASSNAVIHQIDDVLLYSKDQQTRWQSLVK